MRSAIATFPSCSAATARASRCPPPTPPAARQALAETATWVKEDLDLSLRVGLVPVADIRAHGFDVRVARYAPSENISIAMFSGGGIAWADAAMKRGEIAVPPAPPGAHPEPRPVCPAATRKSRPRAALVLSLVAAPAPGANADAFRAAIEHIARIVEHTPDASRPVPGQMLRFTWPPTRRRPRGARLAQARRVGAGAQDQGAG